MVTDELGHPEQHEPEQGRPQQRPLPDVAEGQPRAVRAVIPCKDRQRQPQVEDQHRDGCQPRPAEDAGRGPAGAHQSSARDAEVDARHRHLVDGHIDGVLMALAVVAKPVIQSFMALPWCA